MKRKIITAITIAVAARWVKIVFPNPNNIITQFRIWIWADRLGIEFPVLERFIASAFDNRLDIAFEDPDQVHMIARKILHKWFNDCVIYIEETYIKILHEIARQLGITLREFYENLRWLFESITAESLAGNHA